MRIFTSLSYLILMLALSGATAVVAAEKLLYRYQDAEGKTVLNDQLPPEAAQQGYDVLRMDGSVLKSVAGKPTEEELRRLDEQRVREEEAKRLQEWDEALLLRYSEVEEIEAARERAVGELEARISILNSNLKQLKRRVEERQAVLANEEQARDRAPETLEENVQELKWRISDVEEMIARRRQELKETRASFDRDIHRFRTLRNRIVDRK